LRDKEPDHDPRSTVTHKGIAQQEPIRH
jgi:hypothetical protein